MKRIAALAVALVITVSGLTAGSVEAVKPLCKPAWKCTTPSPAPTSEFSLIFEDQFTVSVPEGQFPAAVSTKWSAYPWGWDDTSNNGAYDPSIISIHDGLMDIFIRTTNGVHRVANPVPKLPGGLGWGQNHQLYGRYEIRARADSMHGYKAAWLQWPMSDTWPRDGEIDFPEGDFDSDISAFMPRQGATSGSDQDWFPTNADWQVWTTYVVEWTPGSVKFYVDGLLIGHSTYRVPNTPMGWRIQNETTLNGFEPDDSVQGHVLIDYVKIWKYQP